MRKPAIVVWPAFLATRLMVLLVAYQAVVLIGFPEEPVFDVSTDPLWNLQARWDAGWYLGISREGYFWSLNLSRYQQNVAFFPAFPMLMRAVGSGLDLVALAFGWPDLLGGQNSRYLLGGTLVALTAFWWALHYLFRFTRAMAGDDEPATNAVWLLAAYPFAVFYGAPYTEALFLLATVGAFHHVARGEYRRAGAWALLAGLTRPNGVLLAAPLGLLAIAPRGWSWLNRHPAPRAAGETGASRVAKGLLVSAMPVVGMLLYSAYLGYRYGRPFIWTEAQGAWGRSFEGFHYSARRWNHIAEYGLYDYARGYAIDLLGVGALLFCIGMLWTVGRRLGAAYVVFVVAYLLPAVLIDLPALGRMTSVLFPVFVALALTVRSTTALSVVGVLAVLQAFAATLFYTWRELY